jgi:fatty-acyl-CoA synthase
MAATIISSIDDIKTLEQTPWEAVRPAPSTYDYLKASAQARPDQTAFTFLLTGEVDENPIKVTYGQFLGRIHQTANMLNDLGVGPTDVTSFLLPLLPQAQYCLWGAEAAGIANPINFLLQPEQIADLVTTAKSKVLIAMGPNPALDIWEKALEVQKRVPGLKLLSVFGPADEANNIFSFDQLLEKYPADKLTSGRQIKPTDIAAYFHTGGTTGRPKLAMHTHENEVYAAWAIAKMWNYQPGEVGVSGLPLFHVAGAFVVSLAPLCAGMELVIPTPAGLRSPVAVQNHWKLVEKYGVQAMGGVPTSLGALLNVPVGDADISSITKALTGGSALPVQVEKDFRKTFGLTVYQMYGQTESTVIISMNPIGAEPKIGSVGIRMPYEEWKIARFTPDGLGETLGPNQQGVLMVKGLNVFPGYLDPAQNVGTLTDDGWLVTGDLGYLDDDGRLFLTGRAKEVIIRSAHNIDPGMIEEALAEHPAVELAAAVGRPDDYAGELPVAYVQLKPGASATSEELLRFVEPKISERPAQPKQVVIIPEMPMTGVGKIFKPQLRWRETETVLTDYLKGLTEKGLGVKVDVGEGPKGGTLATITLSGQTADKAEAEAEVARVVGNFTYIKHQVNWT